MAKIITSFLIPVYNEERHISRCLDSLLSQTVRDIEIVVVDDGSTDSTPQILSRYQDQRVVLFRQPNRGRVAARNKALELSRGKYVILQDADDWSSPQRLNLQLSMAEKVGGKPVVGCGLTFHYETNEDKSVKFFPESNEKIRRTMARPIMASAFGTMTMLALRSHICEVGGWREKFHVAAEDGDLINRLFEDSATRFSNVPAPVYHYYLNMGSITNKLHVTIPAQMFKRYCTRKRRRGLPEPASFEEYKHEVNCNIMRKMMFEIEYHAWVLYMQRQYK